MDATNKQVSARLFIQLLVAQEVPNASRLQNCHRQGGCYYLATYFI